MIELITKDNYQYVNVLILMLQQIKGIENIKEIILQNQFYITLSYLLLLFDMI